MVADGLYESFKVYTSLVPPIGSGSLHLLQRLFCDLHDSHGERQQGATGSSLRPGSTYLQHVSQLLLPGHLRVQDLLPQRIQR